MSNSWYELFNTSRMIFFLAGIGFATAWWRYRCKRDGVTLDLAPIGIIAGVSIIVFLAIQQVGLTGEIRKCNSEFATILKERAALSDQSDDLASQEIDANSHWLATLTSPPPGIATLHTTDPAYRAWVQGTIKDYLFRINTIRTERNAAIEERKAKQYPTPTCGTERE